MKKLKTVDARAVVVAPFQAKGVVADWLHLEQVEVTP
jgi:hypothetical protein